MTPTLRNSLSGDAQNLVKRIQEYITQNLYTCTNKILRGLGKMYSGGGEITTNIDVYGGEGTAVFVANAIELNIYLVIIQDLQMNLFVVQNISMI